MTQAKKASYQVYPLFTDRIIKSCLKIAGKKGKSLTREQVLRGYMHSPISQEGGVNFDILLEEYHWESGEKNVVFPESAAVLDNLMKARFNMDTGEGFSLPHESFVIPMPSGYRYEGVPIPTILVCQLEGSSALQRIYERFSKHYNVKLDVDFEFETERTISITYPFKASDGVYARSMMRVSDIPHLLAAQDLDQFKRIMVERKLDDPYQGLTDAEGQTQFMLLRLIAALGVYNAATEGKRLVKGFPGASEPKMIGFYDKKSMRPETIQNSTPQVREKDRNVSPHYRSWFFRQLRSPRYYQGEYENSPLGSRYTFVSETMVSREVSPYTQKG